MSRSHDRHEGVSCDGCRAENFRCIRYKCLVCFDYDLCAHCFEAGTATHRHSSDHPMQCILTRADYELYYGGESLPGDQPQSFACPFCRSLGFTETTLQEHVIAEHGDIGGEVVCPVCAATPSGEPNHMTDDLVNHLAVEHIRRNEFSQEEARLQRRMPPAVGRGGGSSGVGATAIRGRGRGHAAAAAAAGLSAFARESVDPIAELLSQLGGIRRAGASAVSQIQQLQQQVSRQAPRRTIITTIEAGGGSSAAGTVSNVSGVLQEPASFVSSGNVSSVIAADDLSRLQLPTLFERNPSEEEKIALDVERANRSLFVQELLLSTFMRTVTNAQRTSLDDGLSEAVDFDGNISSWIPSPLKHSPVESGQTSKDVAESNGYAASMFEPPRNTSQSATIGPPVTTASVTVPNQLQGHMNQSSMQNSATLPVRVSATLQRHPQQQMPRDANNSN